MRPTPAVGLLALVLLMPVALAQPAASPQRLRVMTFNLRYSAAKDGENSWDHRRAFLLERIRAADPDLLGTQEALDDQVEFLRANLPGYHVAGVGRDDGARKGEYSAIFLKSARVAVTDSGTFWLSETPEKPGSKSWDSALPRVVTWAKLTARGAPGFDFVYLNTHWDHRGVKARLESARLVRRWVREHAGGLPVVMTGDLNVPEDSEPFKLLLRGEGADVAWIDGYRQTHPAREPDEASFHAFRGTRRGSRIDFILHTRHFRTTEAEIDRADRDGRYPSDHYAVRATLEFTGGTP